MCDCEHKPSPCPCSPERERHGHHGHRDHHGHRHHHGHNNHYDHHNRRFLNAVPGWVDLSEVAVIPHRELPGKPAAKLAKDLGYNVARRSGQQYFNRGPAFSIAYGYYT